MMKIKQKEINASGIKFSMEKEGKEVGRAYLFIMHNDLHEEPFGLLEDVYVEEEYREQGLGTELVKAVIRAARDNDCYKLLCTSRHSRPKIHDWYQTLGFKNYGLEFRMNL